MHSTYQAGSSSANMGIHLTGFIWIRLATGVIVTFCKDLEATMTMRCLFKSKLGEPYFRVQTGPNTFFTVSMKDDAVRWQDAYKFAKNNNVYALPKLSKPPLYVEIWVRYK